MTISRVGTSEGLSQCSHMLEDNWWIDMLSTEGLKCVDAVVLAAKFMRRLSSRPPILRDLRVPWLI